MSQPLPDGLGPDALVLIVLGPVPFMVTVSGAQPDKVIDAYRRAGLPIKIVSEQQAAS